LIKKNVLFVEKKGHWENKFPSKKKKPRLAALFTDELDPTWWDLAVCSQGDYLEGEEVIFLPSEDDSSDMDTPSLDKFFPQNPPLLILIHQI
jgi:hypothetical protein